LIDFLYFGEANVHQENLDSFLAVAEELQLKGLMGSGAEEEAEEVNKPTILKKAPKPVQKKTYAKQESPNPDISSSMDKVETFPPLEGTVAVTDYTVATDLQDLDDKIKSMMMFSENRTSDNNRGRICKVCGKEGQWAHIRNHIEVHHITGFSHTCNICGTTTRSRETMRQHKRRNHTNMPQTL